jgi:ABC-type dipeptide/oligopeptide/nickel transport system permease subunit
MAVAGLMFLVLLVLVAVLAPILAPYDPNAQELVKRLQPPSGSNLLGTDSLGRDSLSRLIYGTQVSLLAGLQALAVAAGIGIPLGLIAGYVRGKFDTLANLVSDALMAVPGLILALAIIAVLGPGLTNAMMAIGLTTAPRFYRLARVSTMDLRNDTFIEASTAMGCSRGRIMLVHILPNAMPPLIVQATFVFGAAILAEASLSFLGLGVEPPTASWGAMLSDAAQRLDKSYLIWGPGVALTLAVLAFAAVGDGWRDALGLEREDNQ